MAERFTLEKTSDENIASGNQPWRVGKSTITGFSQQLLWFQGFPSHGNDDTGGFFLSNHRSFRKSGNPDFFQVRGSSHCVVWMSLDVIDLVNPIIYPVVN